MIHELIPNISVITVYNKSHQSHNNVPNGPCYNQTANASSAEYDKPAPTASGETIYEPPLTDYNAGKFT